MSLPRITRSDTACATQSDTDYLLNAIADGALLLDAAGCIVALNKAAVDLIGGSRGNLVGAVLADHLGAQDGDVWASLIACLGRRQKSECLIKTCDARNLLVSLRTLQKKPGAEIQSLITLRDVDVIDHERGQAANPSARTAAFRFASEGKLRPDLNRQRQISRDLDHIMGIAERTVLQGARLLILGESGVGKTELARYVHDFACDHRAPFVHVNCGSIPETLFEAELFGYERGAFTGALQSGRKGYIEAADGGTLFLDEVGEVPLLMQSRLLKFLESGSIQRVGSSEERSVRVRVISATNRDLEAMVDASAFRRDLYFRLAVVPISVKPLRDAPELIGEISDYFLTIINQNRVAPLVLSDPCRDLLQSYAFPGNIRELFNILQQLSVMAETTAGPEHLPPAVRFPKQTVAPTAAQEIADLKKHVRHFERDLIDRAIATYGSKRKAAEALGVDIGTIVRKTQVKH